MITWNLQSCNPYWHSSEFLNKCWNVNKKKICLRWTLLKMMFLLALVRLLLYLNPKKAMASQSIQFHPIDSVKLKLKRLCLCMLPFAASSSSDQTWKGSHSIPLKILLLHSLKILHNKAYTPTFHKKLPISLHRRWRRNSSIMIIKKLCDVPTKYQTLQRSSSKPNELNYSFNNSSFPLPSDP